MTLQFQTYSIVAGTPYCNASCFFCVSKMTTRPEQVRDLSNPEVDWRNFHKATKLAQMAGVTTVLITGKGEPTMYPRQITDYLSNLQQYAFPIIELQTNGTLFQNQRLYGPPNDHLKTWYDLGLTTVIISVVGINPEQNRRIYLPNERVYPSLEKTVEMLHDEGLMVRLGVVMLKDHVDSPERLDEVVAYCKNHGIEQLTFRPVNKASNTQDPETNRMVEQSQLTEVQIAAIKGHVESHGTHLLDLVHGGSVYDLHGQNVCLTHSLTKSPQSGEIRSLIFYSTGETTYDWENPGAIIFGKSPAAREREKESLGKKVVKLTRGRRKDE